MSNNTPSINPYQSPESNTDFPIIADDILTEEEKDEDRNNDAALVIALLILGSVYAINFDRINNQINLEINNIITRLKDTFDTPLK